jgi:hypothetical protein
MHGRAPAKPRPDETLIRALARVHRWKRLLEEGKYRSAGELAEAEGVTRSFVNRLLRLTLLAPDIVEAILEGRQPKGVQLEELTDAMPSEWEKHWNAGRFSPRPDPDGSSKRCDCLPVKSRLAELAALERHLRIQNPFGRSESGARPASAPRI